MKSPAAVLSLARPWPWIPLTQTAVPFTWFGAARQWLELQVGDQEKKTKKKNLNAKKELEAMTKLGRGLDLVISLP